MIRITSIGDGGFSTRYELIMLTMMFWVISLEMVGSKSNPSYILCRGGRICERSDGPNQVVVGGVRKVNPP